MVPFLYTPREHHNVRTPQEYLAVHAAFIAQRRVLGARFQIQTVATPIKARVDANTWLIDCECGAGNATDPTWGMACCFGCGTIHTAVVFPVDAKLIEAVLVQRADVGRRGWDVAGQRDARTGQVRVADQSVADLVAESVAVRAPVPDVVAHLVAVEDIA